MAAKKNTKKVAPKKAAAKKPAAKKPAPKKPAAKKPVAKKPAPKKPAAKKPAAKKPAPKKPVAKKAVAKKPAPKKPIAKKAVAKKPAPKKPVAKKAVVKKPVKAVAPKKAEKAVKKPIAKSTPVAKTTTGKKEVKAEKTVLAPAKKEKEVKAKIEKPAAPEPKKPEMRMASSKPEKKETAPVKKSILSQPTDIKAFANLNKTFKIPVAKPNVMRIVPANTDTRSRYSDSELQEFKEIILNKLSEARKDLELLRGSLSHTDDHGTDDTSPTFKMMEDGSETLSREETAQLAGRQEKFIMALENALIRIENKTYGICRVTGKLISKERLKLVPHTTLSIEAKNMQD